MDTKAICAMILGCKPGELRNFRDYGTFVSVIDLAGRKFIYTTEHLQEVLEESKPKEPIPEKYLEVGGLRLAAPSATPKPAKKTAPAAKPGAKTVAKRPVKKPAKASNPTKAKK